MFAVFTVSRIFACNCLVNLLRYLDNEGTICFINSAFIFQLLRAVSTGFSSMRVWVTRRPSVPVTVMM